MKAVAEKGKEARFYPRHSDAAAVRKIEQFCGAVGEIAAVQQEICCDCGQLRNFN
jgi:hypothetical protein